MSLYRPTLTSIREWANFIQKKFPRRLFLTNPEEHVVGGIGIVVFKADSDPSLSAKEVTNAVLKQGMRYASGHRYFFIFDKEKQLLVLQLYPFNTVPQAVPQAVKPCDLVPT